MKNCITIIALILLVSNASAQKPELVGSFNLVSTRNIETGKDYVLLSSYAGGTDAEMKKSKALTADDAINNVVKSVAGGVYMMNVKIYLVGYGKYYAAQGDVYGIAGQVSDQHGWKVGDHVQYSTPVTLMKSKGVIIDLNNNNECTVKDDASGKVYVVKFDKLVSLGAE